MTSPKIDEANTLAQLKDRIEKASGEDFHADALIWWMFFAPEDAKRDAANKLPDDDDISRACWARLYYGEERATKWTASVDAALSLVEKMLPGCGYGCSLRWPEIKRDPAEAAHGWIHHGDDTHEGDAATPALALLSALLKAIQAKGERDGE